MTLIAAQKEPQMGQIEEQLNQNPFISAGERLLNLANYLSYVPGFVASIEVPVQDY